MKTIETTDMYKAAYCIMYGGILSDVHIKKVAENRRDKKGTSKLYVMVICNVPEFALQSWDTGQAYGNITEFARFRWRLKEKLRKNYLLSERSDRPTD